MFVNMIHKDNIYGVQYMQINCGNYLKRVPICILICECMNGIFINHIHKATEK